MQRRLNCKIVAVGKRRDGGTRFWCLSHRADATAKYGVRAEKCRRSDIPELRPSEVVELDIADHPAGMSLRLNPIPVYDTTREPMVSGLVVRTGERIATRHSDAYKFATFIDRTRPGVVAAVSELDAIYYFVSSIFGLRVKRVVCTLCGYDHLDKDWFSLHAHQRHLCAGCGRYFRDVEPGVGNPVATAQELFRGLRGQTKAARGTIRIKQGDFPGGIQISDSGFPIFRTAVGTECEGVTVRGFANGRLMPELNETCSALVVDDVLVDSGMVRVLTAQNLLPHIDGRIVSIACPECNQPHFSIGPYAFTPTSSHICSSCGCEFQSRGRQRNVIGNPMIDILSKLERTAVKQPQRYISNLLPETV